MNTFASIRQALRRRVRRLRRRIVRTARPRNLAVLAGGGDRIALYDAKFVYAQAYRVDVPGSPVDPYRGAFIVRFLLDEGLIEQSDVLEPTPAAYEVLRRVHSDRYLEQLQQRGGMQRVLGIETNDTVEQSVLNAQRTMVGGTLLAAELAMREHRCVVNLGGGLHHARADRGHGFCALNDVAVAIAHLRAGGMHEHVLVVDLDLHDGDGTRDIFRDDDSVYTFSIHNQTWDERSAMAATSIALGEGVEDHLYLCTLRAHLPPVVRAFQPKLVFVLAGCDPAANDRLGNWRITEAGLLQRDAFVFESFARGPHASPMVILLAGGYGDESWRYSARSFARVLFAAKRAEPPPTESMTLWRFRDVSRGLSIHELTGIGDGFDLTEEDILPSRGVSGTNARLLGYYSVHGVEYALERYGLFARLRALGFAPTLEVDTRDPAGLVRVYGDADKRQLVIELRLRIDRTTIRGSECLSIEWMLLQDPRRDFDDTRRALPGQKHPGLGLARDIFALLVMICERVGLDAVILVPSHYHVAAQAHGIVRFHARERELEFRALRAALRQFSLAEATAMIERGEVIDTLTHRALVWQPALMVLPVSEAFTRNLEPLPAASELEQERFVYVGR